MRKKRFRLWSGDEAQAQAEFHSRESAVAAAVKAIVLAAAEALASEVEQLEADAADLREKLGVRTYALGQLLAPFGTELARTSPLLSRVFAGIDFETNGRQMRRSLAHMARWKQFADRLAEDPSVELRFDAAAEAESIGLRMLGNRRGYD